MIFVLKKGASESEIEQANEKFRLFRQGRNIEPEKFCGLIKLGNDPLQIQKQLRDEWE